MTVTLVIGAAASGKSAYAESLCLGHDGPRVYLATMEPFGEEGARRIARHRALREGKGFSTLERTRDVGAAVPGLPRGCTLLLEDVGNLVANELFAEGGLSPRDPDAAAREVLGGIERLAQAAAYTVVVTVDVFADGMRYDEGTEAWRRALARVNAGVAALAELCCRLPKVPSAVLRALLAVVLAASIFVMIVSANERYRVAGDFAQFPIRQNWAEPRAPLRYAVNSPSLLRFSPA